MPIPSPKKGQKKDEYISECMRFLSKENKKRGKAKKWTQEQMAAICYNKWDNQNKKED